MNDSSLVSRHSVRSARRLVLAMALAGVPASAATTQPAPVDVPLRSVTLYTSGVGLFAHDGPVSGDGTSVLKFKTGQINDVLKSLVVQDTGGRVTGVNYPSHDPLDKTLKSFQIDLTKSPTVAGILGQLRGAKVKLQFSSGFIEGTVLGVEKQTQSVGPSGTVEVWVLNLLKDGGIQQVVLSGASTIQLSDPALQAELDRALGAIAANRDQDRKPVTIAFTGQGEHRLRVGYVVETPVWKTSYRLLMDPKTPALQGWAIVENQSDADWNDVTLNLVSGRPISFVMDLYSPLYAQRPVVQLDLFQGLKPQIYGGGMAAKQAASAEKSIDGLAAPASARPMPAMRESTWAGAQNDNIVSRFAADGSVTTAALTAKLGELFQYTIEHVNLPRQQSSLVPIVTEAITVEPLSVYNEGVLPRNPLNGAMLTNSTGKLLPQGPVTVLDGGAYAGDARIEDLPAGQKRLLSFGVDLQMLVDKKDDGGTQIVGGKISRGVLVLSNRVRRTQTYTAQNKADHDKTLIIEQPISGDDMTLVDTPEPMEKTDRLYRFKLNVAKNASAALGVTEQHVLGQEMAIVDSDLSGLIELSRGGALPEKVRAAVVEAIRRRQTVADLDRQAKAKADAVAGLTGEQARLRENMRVVDKADPYYKRLLTKLNAQEGTIEGLQKEHDDLTGKAAAARTDLSNYLDGLNVE